jgi:2-oxoglutarate ferredoxin oxidoreductase subunit delta
MKTDSASTAKNTESNAPAARPKKVMGRVMIDSERCKGCGYCVEFCPLGVLAMSTRFNAKGYHFPEAIAPEKCSGCDLCGMFCPDFAICGKRIRTKE